MPHGSLPEKDTKEKKFPHDQWEAARFHEGLFRLSGLAVLYTTPDGIIINFNRAAEQLLGYDASDVVGKTPVLFHDRDQVVRRAQETLLTTGNDAEPAFDVFINKAKESGMDRGEWTFIRQDSTRFHGTLTVICVRDDDDKILGFAAIISDDTRFRLLAENVPAVIYLCRNDDAYTTIYVNNGIQSVTGYPKDEFLEGKRQFADLIHPEDRDLVRAAIDTCISEKKSFELSYRILHSSGTWRWIIERGAGVYQDNKLAMLEGFIQDVTLEKETEAKVLKVAEQNLRFFNSPVNLNAIVDFEGKLTRISPTWTHVLGWTEEELMSQPVFSFVHPNDLERAREQMSFMSTSKSVHTFEHRLMCKDGSYRWLLWALAPDPSAKVVYASAIDISERKRSEENILDSKSNLESITLQLQEQNRRLDEFAHIISHNLRAPLSNIQALINLLNEQSEITDYKLIFEKLKNVAKNLGETMNELMDTLKAKTQQHVNLTEIRFKEVLDKVVQSLEGELIVAQASVTFDFNNAPVIRYSKPYLESIFQNLLTNAVKYRSPDRKPAIHFRSSLEGDRLTLQVKDNGQGIDMEKFGDKLFGLHKTFHNHQEARGVGLFLVKTQIEALGGTITVDSEVDKGTTFTIHFN